MMRCKRRFYYGRKSISNDDRRQREARARVGRVKNC
jgi:hypothetical protein